MDKTILNRVKALEDKKPSDVIIYAIAADGREVTGRVKDILTEDGTLKAGYTGIGSGMKLVVKGSNLKDVDRILKYHKSVID